MSRYEEVRETLENVGQTPFDAIRENGTSAPPGDLIPSAEFISLALALQSTTTRLGLDDDRQSGELI